MKYKCCTNVQISYQRRISRVTDCALCCAFCMCVCVRVWNLKKIKLNKILFGWFDDSISNKLVTHWTCSQEQICTMTQGLMGFSMQRWRESPNWSITQVFANETSHFARYIKRAAAEWVLLSYSRLRWAPWSHSGSLASHYSLKIQEPVDPATFVSRAHTHALCVFVCVCVRMQTSA